MYGGKRESLHVETICMGKRLSSTCLLSLVLWSWFTTRLTYIYTGETDQSSSDPGESPLCKLCNVQLILNESCLSLSE